MGHGTSHAVSGPDPDVVWWQFSGIDGFHEILDQELVRSTVTIRQANELSGQALDFMNA